MADPLRVLLVEDDEDDYVITRDLLEAVDGEDVELRWAADDGAAQAAMTEPGAFDVALVDYRLGARDGLDLGRELIAAGVPVIMLTGSEDRTTDVEAGEA